MNVPKINFDQPVKKLLLATLKDYASLSNSLFDMINDPSKTSTVATSDASSSQQGPDSALKDLMSQLIEKDSEIHKILDVACHQHKSYLELQSSKQELMNLTQHLHDIQKSLIENESVLEQSIKDAENLLDLYEDSKKSTINTDQLITYAHRISFGGVLGSPMGWDGPRFSERPYPTDSEMRRGALGRLSNLPPAEAQPTARLSTRQPTSLPGMQVSTLSHSSYPTSKVEVEGTSEDTSSSSNSDDSS